MKVVALSEFDRAPEVLEVETPAAGTGEVRVRVHAASINGFDLAVSAGGLKGAMEHRFPLVLGKDFAGVVDQLGDGVTEFAVGDRVFGVVTKDFLGDGSFGEYVTVPVAVGVAKLPPSIEFTEAAALGLAGTAAVDAFDAGQVKAGDVVLVAGATGGVGQQILQLAVKEGATVIATASSDAEKELVARLGASNTVDYKQDVAEQLLAVHPEGADVVFAVAGNPSGLVAAIKLGGRLVSTLLGSAADVPVEGIEVTAIYANPSTATLERIAKHEADSHTAVTVERVYSLEETPNALAHFAGGTLGKLVVHIA